MLFLHFSNNLKSAELTNTYRAERAQLLDLNRQQFHRKKFIMDEVLGRREETG